MTNFKEVTSTVCKLVETLLLCSQLPATGAYPESHETHLYLQIHLDVFLKRVFMSSKLPLWFPDINTFLVPSHIRRTHPLLFDHTKNIRRPAGGMDGCPL